MYQLFCDSNCELWHTEIKALGLNVIRMPYVLDGEEYFYDMGENTDLQAFFNKMRGGAVPKTSALNEYAYIEYFEPILARGEDIYYITFSHQMSGTFNAMQSAIAQLKEKYPDREIRYKDSKSISMGNGMIVYYAAQKYKNGVTMDELNTFLDELIQKTTVYFVVDDLTYLHRGGRISGVSKVMGNLLGIKPILHVDKEGKIINIEKVKGKKKALSALLERIKAEKEQSNEHAIYVLHGDCQEEGELFVKMIQEIVPDANVTLQAVGPVIGAHCGPGTIGLIFYAK